MQKGECEELKDTAHLTQQPSYYLLDVITVITSVSDISFLGVIISSLFFRPVELQILSKSAFSEEWQW